MLFNRKKFGDIKANIVQRYYPELDRKESIRTYNDTVSLEGLYELHVVSEKMKKFIKSQKQKKNYMAPTGGILGSLMPGGPLKRSQTLQDVNLENTVKK